MNFVSKSNMIAVLRIQYRFRSSDTICSCIDIGPTFLARYAFMIIHDPHDSLTLHSRPTSYSKLLPRQLSMSPKT